MATVSSHIPDAISGRSAAGIRVECLRLAGGRREPVFDLRADGEGRIVVEVELDPAQDARYELIFHSAEYFASSAGRQIMERVVIRLALPDAAARYHVPLVLSPHAYTLWWSE